MMLMQIQPNANLMRTNEGGKFKHVLNYAALE